MENWAQRFITWSAAVAAFVAFGTDAAATTWSGGDYAGSDVTVANGDVIDGPFQNVGTFTVPIGATVTLGSSGAVSVDANTIDIRGTIDASGAGHSGGGSAAQSSGSPGGGPGAGQGGIAQQCAHPTGGGGAGHGAPGGAGRNSLNDVFAPGGTSYGQLGEMMTYELGSGGGGGGSFLCSLIAIGGRGGDGGGAVVLRAQQIDISGTVRVDGGPGFDANPSGLSSGTAGGGGGSAGTILIDADDLVLSGTLSARGGDGGDIVSDPSQTFAGGGGGGAGGRVKIQWKTSLNDTAAVDVAGGIGGLSGILGGIVVSDDGDDGTTAVRRLSMPPVASNLTLQTLEDTPVAVTLLATDPDGDDLSWSYSQPTAGTLSGTAPNLTYTPEPEASGTETFTFYATDPYDLSSNTATVTIDIAPVNDPPVVSNANIATDEDTSVTVTISAFDADGDTLSFLPREPSFGRVASLGGGVIRYTPRPDANGSDSFEVAVSDGVALAVATVSVDVRPVNDAPIAADLVLATDEDTDLPFVIPASDPDGDLLVFTLGNPSSGSVTGTGPNVTFEPAPDALATVTLGYTVSDGTLSDSGTITIDVNAVNDAPLLSDLSISVDEDASVTLPLTATDVDGDTLTYSAGVASSGLATVSNARLTYTPVADFNGTDAFDVTVSDGSASTVARVTVVVRPVNDAPVASDVSTSTAEDVPATAVLAGSDIDADPLTYVVDPVTTGSVSVSGATLTFTPPADANGQFTVTYRANDGTVESNTAVVTIDVGAENDPPTWTEPTPPENAQFVAQEGVELTFIAAATEPDGDTITYDLQPLPPGASFDPGTGIFSWSPQWADGGTTSHLITATDGVSTIVRNITIDVRVDDSDDDGIPDTRELELSLDPTSPDSDDDFISDLDEVVDPFAPVDTDDDGVIDALDADSDDDGLDDAIEAGDTSIDTPPIDLDADGIANFRDLDSDADSVDDAVDNCPFVSNSEQADGDLDGAGDMCDEDSDGDGLADALERTFGFDPYSNDSDQDFILDAVEFGFGVEPIDTDRDGIFDGLDTDSDDDGVLDALEAGDEDYATPPNDTDFDGLPDYRDVDADDDTLDDGVDNCRLVFNPDQSDLDENGLGDACDGDIDGDGFPDEADNCVRVANPDQLDDDLNGLGNACDDAPLQPVAPVDPIVEPVVPELPDDLDATPDEDPLGGSDRFANSSFSGGSGCSTAPAGSAPPLSILLALVALVALGRVRRRQR